MGDFLDNYVRLKALGIVPFRCINHGPTTSMYYRDPDGNRVELQIDNFATAQEGRDWLSTPAFAENPIGVEYDPDQLVARFRAGVPVAELVVRDPYRGLMPIRRAPACPVALGSLRTRYRAHTIVGIEEKRHGPDADCRMRRSSTAAGPRHSPETCWWKARG
jgi:hypothetical protein